MGCLILSSLSSQAMPIDKKSSGNEWWQTAFPYSFLLPFWKHLFFGPLLPAWFPDCFMYSQFLCIENHLSKPSADGLPCDCGDLREKLDGQHLNASPPPMLKMKKSNSTWALLRKPLARLRTLRHPTSRSVSFRRLWWQMFLVATKLGCIRQLHVSVGRS